MMKKIILLLLTICMTACFCLTAQARSLSRAERYVALQEELHHYLDGDGETSLEDIVTRFMELEAYKKSMAFGLYASILRDVEAGHYSNLMMYTEILRLDEDFGKLLADEENPYPSVDEIEAYALGRQAEDAEDWASAVVYYEQSIAVLDSMMRVTRIRMAGLAELPAETPAPPAATPSALPEVQPVKMHISVRFTGSAVNVNWDAVLGASKYVVYRARGKGGDLRVIGETAGTAYTDADYVDHIWNEYYIEAMNAQGVVVGRSVPAEGDVYAVADTRVTNPPATKPTNTPVPQATSTPAPQATYTPWTYTKPSGSYSDLRMRYRYRDATTTTSYTAWGAWSDWSDTAVQAGDLVQVKTRTVYKYYYFKCPKCGNRRHVYDVCPTWMNGCGATGLERSGKNTAWFTTPYSSAKDWHGTGRYYISGPWFVHVPGDSKKQYSYQTRELQTNVTYPDTWSAWQTTHPGDKANRQIEVQYSYKPR